VPVLAGVFAGAARLVRVVAGRAAVVRSAAFRAGAVRTVLGMRHLLPCARVTADASLGGPPHPAPPSRGRHRLEVGWYCEARALTRTLGTRDCSRGDQPCSPRGGFAMARRAFPGGRAPRNPPRTTVAVRALVLLRGLPGTPTHDGGRLRVTFCLLDERLTPPGGRFCGFEGAYA